MKDFRKLLVWEKSHRLTLAVHLATRGFPKEELYGLSSQIRRAGTSIPANIAEGCGRSSDAELRRFLFIAMGSACELEYHLLLARDLQLIVSGDHETLQMQVAEVKKMLASLISKLTAES